MNNLLQSNYFLKIAAYAIKSLMLYYEGFRYTNHQKIFKIANLAMITVVDSAFWMAKEPRSYTAHLN